MLDPSVFANLETNIEIMLVLRLNIQINKLDSKNARLVRFLEWKGLHLISHPFMYQYISYSYKRILNELLNIFLHRLIYKMADNKFLICQKLRISLMGQNYFSRLSLVNAIYELYSFTLIGENNVWISKEREKEWIKDYNFKFPQWIFGLSSWYRRLSILSSQLWLNKGILRIYLAYKKLCVLNN